MQVVDKLIRNCHSQLDNKQATILKLLKTEVVKKFLHFACDKNQGLSLRCHS